MRNLIETIFKFRIFRTRGINISSREAGIKFDAEHASNSHVRGELSHIGSVVVLIPDGKIYLWAISSNWSYFFLPEKFYQVHFCSLADDYSKGGLKLSAIIFAKTTHNAYIIHKTNDHEDLHCGRVVRPCSWRRHRGSPPAVEVTTSVVATVTITIAGRGRRCRCPPLSPPSTKSAPRRCRRDFPCSSSVQPWPINEGSADYGRRRTTTTPTSTTTDLVVTIANVVTAPPSSSWSRAYRDFPGSLLVQQEAQ